LYKIRQVLDGVVVAAIGSWDWEKSKVKPLQAGYWIGLVFPDNGSLMDYRIDALDLKVMGLSTGNGVRDDLYMRRIVGFKLKP
jgi:hypothetical protein